MRPVLVELIEDCGFGTHANWGSSNPAERNVRATRFRAKALQYAIIGRMSGQTLK
jgi:hypothetical protein